MTQDEAEHFAGQWVLAWNSRDLEAILAHYAEAARFTSPKAVVTVGTPTVHGLAALRAYWQARLEIVKSLVFRLDRSIWDAGRQELVVVYVAEIDGLRTRAAEFMRFGPDGKILEGEAMTGVSH